MDYPQEYKSRKYLLPKGTEVRIKSWGEPLGHQHGTPAITDFDCVISWSLIYGAGPEIVMWYPPNVDARIIIHMEHLLEI